MWTTVMHQVCVPLRDSPDKIENQITGELWHRVKKQVEEQPRRLVWDQIARPLWRQGWHERQGKHGI